MWCVRLTDDQLDALAVLIKAQGESYDSDLKAALAEYASRVRRFGGRPEKEVMAG